MHLREVHTFRSIETEFANLLFSLRDSNFPSPPKSKRGGKRPGAGRPSKKTKTAAATAEAKRQKNAEYQATYRDKQKAEGEYDGYPT